jgi:Tfp pilus assembly protein PilF
MIKLPQIPRQIPARNITRLFPLFLWVSLTGILSVNVFAKIRAQSSASQISISSITMPYNRNVHLKLAKLYFENGKTQEAETELNEAKASAPNVLGDEINTSKVLSGWQNTQLLAKKNYTYWLSVIHDKPDYRDAYIMAAFTVYDLGKVDLARSYIRTALAIDPNYEPLVNLNKILSNM